MRAELQQQWGKMCHDDKRIWLVTTILEWEKMEMYEKDGKDACVYGGWRVGNGFFDPINIWDHWRKIEEKILEDEVLSERFCAEVVYQNPHKLSKSSHMATHFMKANILMRSEALYVVYYLKDGFY